MAPVKDSGLWVRFTFPKFDGIRNPFRKPDTSVEGIEIDISDIPEEAQSDLLTAQRYLFEEVSDNGWLQTSDGKSIVNLRAAITAEFVSPAN